MQPITRPCMQISASEPQTFREEWSSPSPETAEFGNTIHCRSTNEKTEKNQDGIKQENTVLLSLQDRPSNLFLWFLSEFFLFFSKNSLFFLFYRNHLLRY